MACRVEEAVTKHQECAIITKSCKLPDGTVFFDSQVAGHEFDAANKKIGLLRGPNGRVFKPVMKPRLGEREIEFYENLQSSRDPTDVEILRYTPTYHGTKEMRIFDKLTKFIELEDITGRMDEPCVMDVKIGKRTWDPEAANDKIESESQKYSECKEAYGFCIPGFQVYELKSGNCKKFGKDYGKTLNSKSLLGALETFLNAKTNEKPCRDLVVHLLSILWKILALFRSQRKYKFYSSSLLIAYDAKQLRQHIRSNDGLTIGYNQIPVNRVRTFSDGAKNLGLLHKGVKGIVNKNGIPNTAPVSPSRSPRNRTIDTLQRLQRSISLTNCQVRDDPKSYFEEKMKERVAVRRQLSADPTTQHKLCRTHSYTNNFDADIIQMKEDYAVLLAELSSTCDVKKDWVRVYMIDFAHVFPSHGDGPDTNYLNGIENLIKLLEGFLDSS